MVSTDWGRPKHPTSCKLMVVLIFVLLIGLIAISPSVALADVWSSNGPENSNVKSVHISPNFEKDYTLFAGTSDSGIYRSADKGRTWTLVNNGLTNLDVRAIYCSPNFANDNTVFAGTNGGGVFKSTNRGDLWVQVNSGLTNMYIRSVTVSPNYVVDQTVFVGTNGGGVFKSTNGGSTWVEVNNGLANIDVRSLSISPNYANDKTIFAGTNGSGVFKSTDGGSSWTQVNNGLANQIILDTAISPNYANDKTIFAGTNGSGIFKSTDGGANWTAKNSGILPTDLYVLAIAVSPGYARDETVLIGTNGGVYRSANGAASWKQANNGLMHKLIPSINPSPCYCLDKTVYAGSDGGGVYSCVFYTPPVTYASVDPINPDGANGWYITTPTVTLSKDKPGITYYQWDSTSTAGWITYSGSFKALEGQHTLYYYSVDTDGNTEAQKSQVFKVDTGLPADPSVTSSTHIVGGWSNNNIITVNFSGASDSISGLAGYSIEWSQTPTTTPDNILDIGPSESSTSSPALADGGWYFHLRTEDVAGNWTHTVHVGPFNIDTVISPVSILTNPAAADGINGWYKTMPTITLTSSDAGTVYYQWDSTSTAGWTTYSSGFNALLGEHTLYCYSRDLAGNVSALRSRLFKVDTLAPTAFTPSSPVSGASITNASAPTFSWSASSDANSSITYQLYINSNLKASGIVGTSYTLSSPLAPGSYTWDVVAVDSAGNATASSASYTLTVTDVVPPVTKVTSSPYNDGWLKVIPTITLSINESGTSYYQWDSTTGPWATYTGSITAPEGQHTLYYYSVDTAGNVESIGSQVFKLDTGAPGPFDLVSPVNGSTTTNAGPQSFSWNASIDSNSGVAKYQIVVDGVVYMDNITGTSATLPSSLLPGTHGWYVKAVDYAGNATNSTSTFTVNITDVMPPATTLTTNPSYNDGTNGWFKTVPSVTLTRSEPGTTYYQWDSTTGPWTAYAGSFTALEGVHAVYYYSVDSAGNVEPVKSQSFNVDSVAPAYFNLISPANGSSTDNTSKPTLSWSASSDSNSGLAKYQVYIDDVLNKDDITGTSYTLSSPLSPGSHTWHVKAVDYAGNAVQSTSIFTINVADVVPPTTTISTNPVTNDGTNGWFKTTPTITLSRNEAGTTYYQWDSTTGPWTSFTEVSASFAALEGQHTLYYYSTDTAGNVETTRSQAYKVDTTFPSAFDIVTPANGASTTNIDKPAFSWNASTDATSGIKYQLYIDGVIAGDNILTTSYTLASPLVSGSHTWYVKAIDTAGNATNSASTFTINVSDVIAPTTTFSTDINANANGWFKTAPTITLSRNEAGTTYYQWDSTTGPWTTYTGSFKALDGQHTLYYYSTDTAGNVETTRSQTIKVDTQAPTAFDLASPSNGATATNAAAPTFSWNPSSDNNAGMIYQLYIDGTLSKDNITGTSYTPSSPLSVGSHTWYVKAVDIAGNVTQSTSIFTINVADVVPPTTTISTNPASSGSSGWFTELTSVMLTRSEPGTTYYQWDSNGWITYTASTGGFAAPEGQHTLYFYSVDTAGNKESTQTVLFKVDTKTPSTSITSPANGARITGTTYTIAGSSSDVSSSGVAKVEVSINDGAWASATGTTSWSYNWILPADGSYTVKARATDVAGNVEIPGAGASIGVMVDNTNPTVTSVNPADSAVDVSISTSINAAFSEAMNPSTIDTTTFSLKDSLNNPVAGTVTYDASTKTATFKPSSNLAYSTTYTATISTGAKDLAGSGLIANKAWSFTTKPEAAAPVTTLSTIPTYPDGTNGWFKTIPTITLTRDKSGTTYYQWDSTTGTWVTYTGNFAALEGQHTFYYYSMDTLGNKEAGQSQAFKVDAHAPSIPANVKAIPLSGDSIQVTWDASTDNIAVAGYYVYNAGTNQIIASTSTNSYTQTGLLPSTTYRYYVMAFDAAGNLSPASATVSATTFQAVQTSVGSNINVNLGNGVSVNFSTVTQGGTTSAIVQTTSKYDKELDPNFKFRGYYTDISTTAGYAGWITVVIKYDPSKIKGTERNLKLMHWNGQKWVDITTAVDTINHTITGATPSLSPFGVAEPAITDIVSGGLTGYGLNTNLVLVLALSLVIIGSALVFRQGQLE